MPRIRPNPTTTIDDMRARPGMLVSPADLSSARIVTGYTTLKRWIDLGYLPKPFRMPGGTLRWRAGDVLAALGLSQAGETPTTIPNEVEP